MFYSFPMYVMMKPRALWGVFPNRAAIVAKLIVPSSRGGVDATSKIIAKASLSGADGMLKHISDHPVCAILTLDEQTPLL
jgi:hypothetical protein